MATIGRMIFVLGRSSTALCVTFVTFLSLFAQRLLSAFTFPSRWIASLTFSPFGEAVLGTGIYTVALKKLTPPRLRPLAFAVQYASFNFSGALCDFVIDSLRMQDDTILFGARFSGLRIFIFTTWLAVVAALLVVVFWVHDYTVIDPNDPEVVEGGVALPELDINGMPLDEPLPLPKPAGTSKKKPKGCWAEMMLGEPLNYP